LTALSVRHHKSWRRRTRARTSVSISILQVQCSRNFAGRQHLLNLIYPIFLTFSPKQFWKLLGPILPQMVRSSPREFPGPGQLVINASHPDTVYPGPVPHNPIPHTGDKIAMIALSAAASRYQTDHKSRPVPYLTMTVFRAGLSGRVLVMRIGWPFPKVMPWYCTQACIGLWSVDRCFLQQAFLGFSAQAYCRAPQRSASE
jgi:hypothetical protein